MPPRLKTIFVCTPRRIRLLLGVIFVASLLFMCSRLPDMSTYKTNPASPEGVARNAFEDLVNGNFEEALLKHGRGKAKATMECTVVRQCTEEEFETALLTAGVPEEDVQNEKASWKLLMERSGRSFEEILLVMKGMFRRAGEEIAAETQSKGGIASISTMLVSKTEDTAVVALKIKFGDGDVIDDQSALVKESGAWKMLDY